MSIHGWVVLDKPLGLSSAQGVAAVKRILRTGGFPKTKIGHGGTLDPLATGVLPIALGEATKLAGRMLDATKGYAFEVRWGQATATDDAEGEVVAESDVRPTRDQIEAVLPQFRGPIVQVPPGFSAHRSSSWTASRSGATTASRRSSAGSPAGRSRQRPCSHFRQPARLSSAFRSLLGVKFRVNDKWPAPV